MQNSQNSDSLLCNVQIQSILPKSERSSKTCFLKNNFFHPYLSFWLSFPPSMSQVAYDSRRGKYESTQKSHDLDMVMILVM